MDNLQRAIARLDHGIDIANQTYDDEAVEDLKMCRKALKEKEQLLDAISAAKEEYIDMPGIGKTIVNILNDIQDKVIAGKHIG